MRGAATCDRKFGPNARCSAVLDLAIVDGRLVESCPACARMAKGVCRDCPRRVYGTVGKARRCAACDHREKNRREKIRMRRPEFRIRNLANMRKWRKAHRERHCAHLKAYRTRRILRELRAARRAA